jgi:hypothetical protein
VCTPDANTLSTVNFLVPEQHVTGLCSAEQVVATHNNLLSMAKSGNVSTILGVDLPSSDDEDEDFEGSRDESDADAAAHKSDEEGDDGEPCAKVRRVCLPKHFATDLTFCCFHLMISGTGAMQGILDSSWCMMAFKLQVEGACNSRANGARSDGAGCSKDASDGVDDEEEEEEEDDEEDDSEVRACMLKLAGEA